MYELIPYAIDAAYSWNSGSSKEEFENNVDEYIQNIYRCKIMEIARDYVNKLSLKTQSLKILPPRILTKKFRRAILNL